MKTAPRLGLTRFEETQGPCHVERSSLCRTGASGPAWALLGQWGQGLVALACGQGAHAKSIFESVIAEGTSREDGHGAEAARLALVGKARALRQGGDVRGAVRELAEALRDDDFCAALDTAMLARNEAAEHILSVGPDAVNAGAALHFCLANVRAQAHDHAEYARALSLAATCLRALDTAIAREAAGLLEEALRRRYASSRYAKTAGGGDVDIARREA